MASCRCTGRAGRERLMRFEQLAGELGGTALPHLNNSADCSNVTPGCWNGDQKPAPENSGANRISPEANAFKELPTQYKLADASGINVT